MTDVTYPEALRKPLLHLASITEIELQGLPVEDVPSDVSFMLNVEESY